MYIISAEEPGFRIRRERVGDQARFLCIRLRQFITVARGRIHNKLVYRLGHACGSVRLGQWRPAPGDRSRGSRVHARQSIRTRLIPCDSLTILLITVARRAETTRNGKYSHVCVIQFRRSRITSFINLSQTYIGGFLKIALAGHGKRLAFFEPRTLGISASFKPNC